MPSKNCSNEVFKQIVNLLQIFLDIDCSFINYHSTVSDVVVDAASLAKSAMLFEGNQDERNQADKLNLIDTRHEAILLMFGGSRDTLDDRVDTYYNKGNRTDGNQTETIEESLSNSMLKYLDVTQANEIDLKEAFCRDIDAFNTAFSVRMTFIKQSIDFLLD